MERLTTQMARLGVLTKKRAKDLPRVKKQTKEKGGEGKGAGLSGLGRLFPDRVRPSGLITSGFQASIFVRFADKVDAEKTANWIPVNEGHIS
jgi:hypothetical protein